MLGKSMSTRSVDQLLSYTIFTPSDSSSFSFSDRVHQQTSRKNLVPQAVSETAGTTKANLGAATAPTDARTAPSRLRAASVTEVEAGAAAPTTGALDGTTGEATEIETGTVTVTRTGGVGLAAAIATAAEAAMEGVRTVDVVSTDYGY